MSYVAIRAAIKTKLDSLVTAGTLGCVLNGEQSSQAVNIKAFPAAELTRAANSPEYFTNREDMQTYTFVINIYAALEETDWGDVEVAMDTVLDALMQKFLDDVNLSGVIDSRIRPVENPASVVTWQGKTMRREQIILHCPKIKSMP